MERTIFYTGSRKDRDGGNMGKLSVYLQEVGKPAECIQSFLCPGDVGCVRIDSTGKFLMTLLETREIETGQETLCGGLICVYEIQADGRLSWLCDLPSCGPFPIDLYTTDEFLAVVNHGSTVGRICKTGKNAEGTWETFWEYDEASLVLFTRNADGIPGGISDLYKFYGSGSIPFFQESAAPHSIAGVEKEKLLFVPERGSDHTSVFEVQDHCLSKLMELKSAAAAGPRNTAVIAARDGYDIYVVHEITPDISYFRIEKNQLRQKELYREPVCVAPQQTMKVISEGKASHYESDIRLFTAPHPVAIEASEDGTRIYTLTRSANLLTVFSRDRENGELHRVQEYQLAGENPREMHFLKEELYIAFQDTGNCIRIKFDEHTGCPSEEEQVLVGISEFTSLAMKIEEITEKERVEI